MSVKSLQYAYDVFCKCIAKTNLNFINELLKLIRTITVSFPYTSFDSINNDSKWVKIPTIHQGLK